jgi:hypothetical protein
MFCDHVNFQMSRREFFGRFAIIIPVLAIPVSLIGTFFFMWLAGFTINVLTLLGIVLAIGLVVVAGCASAPSSQDVSGGTIRNSASALSGADGRCRQAGKIAAIRYIDRASNTIAFDCIAP